MSVNFNTEYINSTLQILERRCLTLLSEGYCVTKSKGNISIDWEEEDISKELLLSLNTNRKRLEWQIDIIPEYRIYKNNGIAAKCASRIDFRFSGWATNQWEYFVEAKNLIEVDTPKKEKKDKKGNAITVRAKKMHERYVKTGIDSYLSGRYPSNGCLIGYILQGEIDNIIYCLNDCLCNANRTSEILEQQCLEIDEFDSCYVSIHDNNHKIKHLMLDYTFN